MCVGILCEGGGGCVFSLFFANLQLGLGWRSTGWACRGPAVHTSNLYTKMKKQTLEAQSNVYSS